MDSFEVEIPLEAALVRASFSPCWLKRYNHKMSALLALTVCILSFSGVATSRDLRHVDFKNFAYPWSGPPSWSDQLEWLNPSEPGQVRLTDGRWADDAEVEERSKDSLPFAGLTLESVQFGDVTGDGRENAIVVLRYDTGGTQFSYYVYIYSFKAGHPGLLGYFHAGDRAYSGLYQVYAQNKELVVEFFDPKKRTGDCCSSGFIRTRYRWRGGKFEAEGPTEFGTPKASSRIPVSTFGTHQQP
jgi:hypothetical protein